MKAHNNTRVVILGGGYVGVHAYRSLIKGAGDLVRSGKLSITVIDPHTHHTFHGWSGETVAGIIRDENRLSPLRQLFPKAEVVRGYAVRVNRAERKVIVAPVGSDERIEIPYDQLIIGTGVRDSLDSIPGVQEYGITLRGSSGPDMLRQRVIELTEQAELEENEEKRRSLLRFVIAGAGFTGVEMAAAIAELLKTLRPDYRVLQEIDPEIILVHAGGMILPQLGEQSPKLADYATRQLLDYGVRFRFWTRMIEITPEGAALNDGTFITAGTVISTIGTSIKPMPGTGDFRRDRLGRIFTSPDLRAEQSVNIWVGGDSANVYNTKSRKACPQNALWAIKQGEHIGKNLARLLTGMPVKPFTYPGLGQAASLGIGKGIVELRGMQFTGVIAWIMRLFFFLHFTPSRSVAFRALVDWVTLPIGKRNRSLNGNNGIRTLDGSERKTTSGFLRFSDITAHWN
ncbi:MAG: NAD(P)/FAD-dependent oxidoreductase [Candidatus Kapaibacterium sp.]